MNMKCWGSDPTISIQQKVYKTLFKFKNYFNDKVQAALTPFYFLHNCRKVHKSNVLLMPLVSSRFGSAYSLQGLNPPPPILWVTTSKDIFMMVYVWNNRLMRNSGPSSSSFKEHTNFSRVLQEWNQNNINELHSH